MTDSAGNTHVYGRRMVDSKYYYVLLGVSFCDKLVILLTEPKFAKVSAADLFADAEIRPHHKNARRRGDGMPRRMHCAAAAHSTPAHRTGCAATVYTQL